MNNPNALMPDYFAMCNTGRCPAHKEDHQLEPCCCACDLKAEYDEFFLSIANVFINTKKEII